MLLMTAVGWPDVAIAMIAGLPGIIAAVYGRNMFRQLKTPSGTSVGKQVENMHHTALANNYRLQALGNGLDVPMPDVAAAEEERIEGHNTVQTRHERGETGPSSDAREGVNGPT